MSAPAPARCERLIVDANVATMLPLGEGDQYGVVTDAAIAIDGGTISWVGPRAEVAIAGTDADSLHSAFGLWITPGLVDCHTHLVFGGDRVAEWERRLGGASYAELAAAGGGIASTVAATAAASDEELEVAAVTRLGWLRAAGASTVEVKSGYGLDTESELRLLRVARRAGVGAGVRVVTTLLAAHTLPPGRDRTRFVDEVCAETIPAAAAEGLATAVDAFCETIAFSPSECERVLSAAVEAGLRVKLHADQLTDSGGAALAARFGALSADHLEHTSPAGVSALAAAGTVAVLVPGATLTLGETARPPVAALRATGVPMAVATDLNPGTSPVASLPLAANLACALLGLTPAEALAGITRHAAAALGLSGLAGVIAPGAFADLALWDVTHPAEIVYWLAAPLCRALL